MTPRTVSDAIGTPKPWYRHRWPWLLIAGPAIVIVAGLGTLWLAIVTDDGVVADDYYRQGLLINRAIEKGDRGIALQAGAIVRIDARGGVEVELTGPVVASDPPGSVRLKLTHATRAGLDRVATLDRGNDGNYRGRIDAPPAGRWLIAIDGGAWRLPALEFDNAIGELRLGNAREAR